MEQRPVVMDSPELMVIRVLKAATDCNHNVVAEAEKQLNEWETVPGFFRTLAQISVSCSSTMAGKQMPLDANVRWMAAVYLKNGVNKFWRRGVRPELPVAEKEEIRDLLLKNFINEPVPQVLMQIALLMSRIARFDFPNEWRNLLPELLERLQLSDPCNSIESNEVLDQQEQRVLLVLLHVVKAKASCRLKADRKVFEDLCATIYEYILKLWDTHSSLFFHQLKTEYRTAINTIQKSILCTRILRKLTRFGFSKPLKSECCLTFVEMMIERLKLFLNCRYELLQMNVGGDRLLIESIEKLILKQMKILIDFQETHPVAFCRFIGTVLQFCFDHVFHCSAYLIFTGNHLNFEQFAIHSINLMMGILLPLRRKWERKACNDDSYRNSVNGFFTNERISYMCEKMITHYLLLTRTELDHWQEDAEEYAQNVSGGDSWKYSLRPCVEKFFLTFVSSYQQPITDEMCKYIRKAQETTLTEMSDLNDILLKDAIYNMAGLAAIYLFDSIDTDTWFRGQLLSELKIMSDKFRILRTRIIWMVGKWVDVHLGREVRPLAYEACLHLLRSDEDMTTRLAAATTLASLIEDFDFSAIVFLPYMELIFEALFLLLRESKECETKMRILSVMSKLVEKMSDSAPPQVEHLLNYLPILWKENEENNMLRAAIICNLEQLVKVTRTIPDGIGSFLYDVIVLSTNVHEKAYVYLIEDGLSLWLCVVENSTNITPPLLELCRNIMPIIQSALDNLRTVLFLIQAYIVLDMRAYMERYGCALINFLNTIIADTRPEGLIMILKIMETCLKTDSAFCLPILRPILTHIFEEVYLNKDLPMLTGMHLMIVARVLLSDRFTFMEIVQSLPHANALEVILDVWIEKMPLITDLEKRKLFSLAFMSVFSNDRILLQRFPLIMKNIGEALYEIMRIEDESTDEMANNVSAGGMPTETDDTIKPIKYTDSLVFVDEVDLDSSDLFNNSQSNPEPKSYHYDRYRRLSLNDPVHKLSLLQCFEWQLGSLRTQLGEESYTQLMRTVPDQVLDQLNQFLPLRVNNVVKN